MSYNISFKVKVDGVDAYVEPDISDDDLIIMMPEWLFDDVRATEHVIGLLYQAAWVCAELREHLKQFEDKEDADGKTYI